MVIMNAFRSRATDPNFPLVGFVGNGYLGMQVSQLGIGPIETFSYMQPPLTLIAGIFQDHRLFNHPLMRECHILVNGTELPISFATVKNYSQELDRQHATIITEFDLIGAEGLVHCKTTIFASGPRKHLCVLRIEAHANFEGTITILHGIDGNVSPDSTKFTWGTEKDLLFGTYQIREDRKVLYMPENPNLPCAVACAWKSSIKPFKVDSNQTLEDITVTLRFAVKKGDTVTLDKFFCYFTGREAENPEQVAIQGILAARDTGFQALLDEHRTWWEKAWETMIEVPDPQLQAYITAVLYSIYTSLRPDVHWSIAPNGLVNYGWEGHVFWDADLWVYLGICLLRPDLARCITQFRKTTLDGAIRNRADHQSKFLEWEVKGAKFPWQATSDGRESAPGHWGLEEHITCDVAFAQYYDWLLTGDKDFLKGSVWPIFRETSRYWITRIAKGKGNDPKFHLLGVIPPDEFVHPGVCDDNAFTNIFIMWVLQRAIKLAEQMGEQPDPEWKQVAGNMYIPIDMEGKKVFEYEGYTGKTIKQADTDLITFPLEWPIGREMEVNNLRYYQTKLPPNHIAMSSAIYSVVAAHVGAPEEAWHLFRDLYPHFHDPLTIMSEAPSNMCAPFTTGGGGFLMALLYGFCGIRVRERGLLLNPCLPPELPRIAVRKLTYRGQKFDLIVSEGGSCVELRPISGKLEITIYWSEGRACNYLGERVTSERCEPGVSINTSDNITLRFPKTTGCSSSCNT